MNIKNYLRKLGYRPDLADGVLDKFEKTLYNYMKEQRYEEFCELRERGGVEQDIINFIGDDIKLLKIIMSAQIKMSISILEKIILAVKNIHSSPNQILDLGGSDGWAVNFLNTTLQLNCPLTVIDRNNIWNNVNENVTIINKPYSEFNTDKKYDLIISILGASHHNSKELFECIERCISEKGIALLGLRISSDIEYVENIKLTGALGLRFIPEFCDGVQVFDEKIPIIALEKSDLVPNNNDYLKLAREGFAGLQNPKRLYGFEANVLFELIKDGERISFDEIKWDNGDYMELEVIEKNNILYRKTLNHVGDIIIEYPVKSDDSENSLENQISRMQSEYIFNNTL
ncbi:hypothetical protein MWU50_07535 [Flavobacteriaceae bacterium S0862]|nr:hypothetical protein [Flavobacteriaceae bacterium S0862]